MFFQAISDWETHITMDIRPSRRCVYRQGALSTLAILYHLPFYVLS